MQTTHYRSTIDLEHGSAQLQGLDEALDPPGDRHRGVSQLPVDVWVGDDGFVHKVQYTQARESRARRRDLDGAVSTSGRRSTITPPPATTVIDFAQLLGPQRSWLWT